MSAEKWSGGWYLFVVAFRMDLSTPHLARQSTDAVPFENSVNSGIRDSHPMVVCHVPHDPEGSEMIFLPQMQYLLDNLIRCLIRMRFSYRLLTPEPFLTVFYIEVPPTVQWRPGNTKVAEVSATLPLSTAWSSIRSFRLISLSSAFITEPSVLSKLHEVSKRVVHSYNKCITMNS